MIIFDLDGTLLNVWKRYYYVFNTWWKLENLDIEQFVKLKRKLVDDERIIKNFIPNVEEKAIISYKSYKAETLERPDLLQLDQEFFDLKLLKDVGNFRILTVRRNTENLFNDLRKRGFDFLIDYTVVLRPSDKLVKYRWIVDNFSTISSKNEPLLIVGDSETDLLTAKMSQVNVFLVNTGLRDPYALFSEYKDEILSNVKIIESAKDLIIL
jgi:phosphoglycolate phosphatase-like HAD superfamily hydrolase